MLPTSDASSRRAGRRVDPEDERWLTEQTTTLLSPCDEKWYFASAMHAFSAPRARNIIANLAARGQYHFTASELRQALGVSAAAARQALSRLAARGEIASPARGFYVIVPPEYRRLGCLPADQFILALMERRNIRYYVGLLSAAQHHGAAHHRPQEFQVVLEANRPAIVCGSVRVAFVARRNLVAVPVESINNPRPRCGAGNGAGLDGGGDGRRSGWIHASCRRGGPGGGRSLRAR